MPPKGSRAKAVVDAPAGGGDPASKSSPGKGKEVIDNLPSEAEVTAGCSGLSIEEKLQALATVVSEDTFIEDDSDEELEIGTTKSAHPHLRFTAILLFPVIPSREVASVILTVRMLMKCVWSNLLTDDVLASVKFHELTPAWVAKTRYSRLQVSFLHESDAVKIKQTAVEHKRKNGTTMHCFWLHQEDAAYLRKKASSPQLLEVYFKDVPADIPPELVKEPGSHLLIMGDFNLVEDPLLDRTSRKGTTKENEELYRRPGVRKVIEAVERQADSCGEDFELLISRLNTALRAYAKEERKRVRATMSHLHRSVAELKQAWLGDPGCARLKSLLDDKEAQLKAYQLARQERLHEMAGMREEVMGEVASPHLSAKIKARKGRTQITELNACGTLVNDNGAILGAASQYYRELFGRDRQQAGSAWSPAPGFFPQQSAEAVCTAWSEEEVKSAFHSMANDKAPGKDGLPNELFELHWDILGKHFMQLARNFAATATLPTSTKDAVTILLHKKGGRDQLENYRPITLLSFTYKVIARVVADRMKKVLHEVISPEQYGFLPGRKLSEAVGLVADVIEAAKNKDRDWYLLLVDFMKAFDSVSRGFLFTVLERMGFPSLFVDWVRGLHKDTRTSLLINGWMGEAVDVVSGVRQGCPLAPYLFLCAVEPLAQKAAARNLGLEGGSRRLAYLGYADDTTLILQGEEQIEEAERLSTDFEADCTPTWEKAFVRIKEKLGQWETQHLTTGARVAVINCYISPIIFFQAQVYPPPVDIWGRILKLAHNFVSGNHAVTDKKFILWSRELLYMARGDGGVGVRDPDIELTCLAARRIGLLLTETCELKREIMLDAADLPLGTDTFVAHVKLLKCWRGKSERWKLACGSFMQSPLAESPPDLTREEIEAERIVLNRNILLNGKTPVGAQKAAAKQWELRLGDLLLPNGAGGLEVKDAKTLARELGGSKQAKLVLRAWEAVPQIWKEGLLSAELPQ
ncbi:unnamed protein product [Closterium sp. NIES-65]|nr:unnamed protein product [Closterium sp. NIES-65]